VLLGPRPASGATIVVAVVLALGLTSCAAGDQPSDVAVGHRSTSVTSTSTRSAPGSTAGSGPATTQASAPTDDEHADHHADDHHAQDTPVVEGSRAIAVTATSFEFEPAEITVTAGEDVAIALTSDDVLHDFTVEGVEGVGGVEVHVAAEPGETARGGLRVAEPGEYRITCTVEGHRDAGMEGTLVVEPAPS
jgi:plastocyanin